MGYTACPSCGQPCQTTHGILSHQARAKCNISRSTTPDLIVDYNANNANNAAAVNLRNGENLAAAIPARPTTLLAGSRRNNKRRRTSQSPPVARERARPRARNIHTYYNPPATTGEQAIRLLSSLQPQQDQDDLQQDQDSLQQDQDSLQWGQDSPRLGSSYGSPNDSTIGLIEGLLPSPHGTIPDSQQPDQSSTPSSPAESGIILYAQNTNQARDTRNNPDDDIASEYCPSPTPLPVYLGPQIPLQRTYGDEHTPPPVDITDATGGRGHGQDSCNSFQPRNKYLQQLFSYNHVQARDHTFRGSQATYFADAAARCAAKYNRQPTERHLLDFLLLPKVGLTLGIQSEEFSVKYTLQQYPDFKLPPPTQVETEETQEHLGHTNNLRDTPTRRAQRLIERGYLSRAARALTDPASLARNSAEILTKLKDKHPIGRRGPFASGASPRPGPRPVADDIHQALASFATDTAAGLSGWSVPLLREACKQTQVVEFLLQLCKQIQNGSAPGNQLLTASRLVALDKEDNGVRPIAVGEMVYRLVAKVILRKQFATDQLASFQLGVQSPGGVEPIVHLLQHAVDGDLKGYTHICLADFKNAFNSVSRVAVSAATLTYAPEFYKPAKWAYNEPSALVMYDGTVITSSEGVRQGDPLGPLLFSLAIRDTLQQLQKQLEQTSRRGLPPPIVVAYLDDVYIISGQEITPQQLERHLQQAPISLNRQKTKSYNLRDLRQLGLRTLGSFIGSQAGKKEFLQRKTEELQQVLDRLQDLPKQHALLLLRASTTSLLRHLPRTLQGQELQEEFQGIDQRLLQMVKHLQGSTDSKPLDQDLVALPTRLGGLGITLYAETASLAYQNSRTIADITLQRFLPAKLFWRLPREPSPSPSQTAPQPEDLMEQDDLQQDQGDLQRDQEDLQRDQDDLQQDQDDLLQDQDDLQQDQDDLQQDQGDLQQDQDSLSRDRGRSRTRATQPTQHSLAYFLAQSTQQDPQFPMEHQQINPTSTGPARTIYRTAIDKLHKARLARIQQKLTPMQEAVRMENAAYLGRRWLTALPTSQPLLLADMDIAAALCIRLLTTPEEEQDICRHCNRAYTFGHEDACRARTRQTVVKHDKICQALATALRTNQDNKVFLEPRGDYRDIRTDIRIDNPKGTLHLDVSIISLTKEQAKADPYATLATEEQVKRNKYRVLGQAFKPFILSQGGLLGKDTSQTYKELQRSFLPSTAEWLDKYISVLLIRLRARNWMGYGID